MLTEFTFPINIFLYSFLAIACALIVSPLSIYLTRRIGLIDRPGKFTHKIHSTPTPVAGGTALILCLILLSVLFGLWKDKFTQVLIIAVAIVYLFGLLDDIRGLSALPKLTGQFLASIVLIASNISVHFIGSMSLPFLSPLIAKWLDIALTLFWLIGVTNAMNMIDSMDGIAIGVSGIAFLFFVLVTSLSGQTNLTEISTILLGVSAGIYFYNVTPARLFLGDSGSQTLGFIVAAIAMEYAPVGLAPTSSWFVPILLVGMPIFDTSLVVYSRIRRGLPVYRANLDHTYHRLVALGLDERRAVLTIHMTAILLSLVAFATFYLSPAVANLIFGMILLTGIVIILLFDYRK
ncbi:MAG: MraY family glycosyltransferase [Anaerolineales bacterium]|jgi:UDP-GlcNAc:undecaprenyl-phosphate GlcNAc-1-phosphate transferase